jgi:hypothetical protein
MSTATLAAAFVDRGLAEGQAILQVRAEAHCTEGGYCRIAAHPKQAISAFDADQLQFRAVYHGESTFQGVLGRNSTMTIR